MQYLKYYSTVTIIVHNHDNMQDGSTSKTMVFADGGKTQAIKKWAQNSSYKNPCLTLATRHQQYAAYVLSSCCFSGSEAVAYAGKEHPPINVMFSST